MNADVVNLRRVRKAKARDARAADGEANRLKHGRPRAEREAQSLETARAERHLDSHRLTDVPGSDDGG